MVGYNSHMRAFFNYPNPVNEVAARVIAGLTAILVTTAIVFDLRWIAAFLLYEFTVRVAAGPKISLTAQLATRVLVPLIGAPARPVPGPPKRFAQALGVLFTGAACFLWFAAAQSTVAKVVLGMLGACALLEAALGFCVGCAIFMQLMRVGLIPESTCAACANWKARA